MNKEDAKKYIAGRLELASRLDDPLTGNQKVALVRNLQAAVDAIEVEHKPVVLPQKVGEQWTKLVYCSYQSVENDWSGVNYALNYMSAIGSSSLEYHDLVHWWINTKDSYTQLVDAARYGWKPKPEKHFVLPMVKAKSSNLYAFKDRDADPDENWDVDWDTKNINSLGNYFLVTQSDIDSAPAWVKAIKPVEVRHD